MFTGIVERVGRVVEFRPRGGSTRLGVASDLPHDELRCGDSVAVDGACLTVVERRGDAFAADVVAETLARTTLGGLRVGRKVNLERALRWGDRLGGHLVAGHVDGTLRVLEVRRRGDDRRVRLELPGELRRYVAVKGSVALAGVSLTIAAVAPAWLEVALVPYTLSATTLGSLRAGARLNVEVDLVARYLEGILGAAGAAPAARTHGRGSAT